MAEDDGPCHDGRCCCRAYRFLPVADRAGKVRFGDDAGQQSSATACDQEIGMGFAQEFRSINEWSILCDGDEALACGG
jgi:hypothetical protein